MTKFLQIPYDETDIAQNGNYFFILAIQPYLYAVCEHASAMGASEDCIVEIHDDWQPAFAQWYNLENSNES